MNTLFNTTFENEEASHYENKVQLRPQMYELQESNVNLKLTIVHTVGFGDQINKEERYGVSAGGRERAALAGGQTSLTGERKRGTMCFIDSNLAVSFSAAGPGRTRPQIFKRCFQFDLWNPMC